MGEGVVHEPEAGAGGVDPLLEQVRQCADRVSELVERSGNDDHKSAWLKPVRALWPPSEQSEYETMQQLVHLDDALTELASVIESESGVGVRSSQRDRLLRYLPRWMQSNDSASKRVETLAYLNLRVRLATIDIAPRSWLDIHRPLEPVEGIAHGAESDGQPTDETLRHRLSQIAVAQAEAERDVRGRAEVRAQRLLFTGAWVGVAAVCFAVGYVLATAFADEPSSVRYLGLRTFLALAGGALGAAVAGSLRLRDAAPAGGDDLAFKRPFLVQLALGAGIGVVAQVLVEMGALPTVANGNDVELVAFYGFAAGWSNSLVLNAFRRASATEGPATAHPKD